MLLGSMCAAAAPGLLAGRKKQQQLLELFEIALGQSAADALTGAAAVAAAAAATGSSSASAGSASAGSAAAAAGSPGFGVAAGSGDVELELAVSCWWRAAALQALSAYVLGVMGKGFAEDPAQQVRACRHMHLLRDCIDRLSLVFLAVVRQSSACMVRTNPNNVLH
jgi:hypothetical protein